MGLFFFKFSHYFCLLILSTYLTRFTLLEVEAGLSGRDDWLFPSLGARIYSTEKRGTYFGYSVAGYVSHSQAFCLIGAPKAQNDLDFLSSDPVQMPSEQRALTDLFGNTSGLIYRLNLDLHYPDCSRMPIANDNEDRRLYGTLEPGMSLWNGGLVAATSNGGDGLQLGCDPRYLYTPAPVNTSFNASAFPPGMGMQNLGIGTCALYTGVSMQYTPIDACIGAEEGACLSGFSGALEPGDEPGEAFVVIGMPGSYLTEGNVFFGHYLGQSVQKQIRLKSSPLDLKYKGFNLGYAVGLYKHPQWDIHDYPSASNRFTILASSPMWVDNDYRGVVMLLTEALNLDSIRYIDYKWSHIGSFFGYSIAAADLNGDGTPEVIVGSPYFSENQRLMKSQEAAETLPDMQADHPVQTDTGDSSENRYLSINPDVGQVYIFYGKSEMAISDSENEGDRVEYMHEPPVILRGPRSSGGRFGHVVLSVGDLDGDGINDMAVSCPFCQDTSKSTDKGAVYIYLGRKDEKIKDEPDQVIYPSNVPDRGLFACEMSLDATQPPKRHFSAFGWSMASKLDVDGNMSPDLIVGDYESEQVVTFRSRNLMWLEQPLWRLPEEPTLEWSGPRYTQCNSSRCRYRVALKLSLHARESVLLLERPTIVLFRYRIDLDSRIEQDNNKRMRVALKNTVVVEDEVEINLANLRGHSVGSRQFQLFEIDILPLWQQTAKLIWKPVVFNVTMELLQNGSDVESPGWSLHPTKGERIFLSQPMRFSNPDCGHDHICVPDLKLEVYDTSEGFDFGREGPLSIYFKERVSERNFTVAVRNTGEYAYDTEVRIYIPAQFACIPDRNYACKIESEPTEMATLNNLKIPMTVVVCGLINPFVSNGTQWAKLHFQLGTSVVFQPPLDDTWTRSTKTQNILATNRTAAKTETWEPPNRLEIIAEVTSDNENMRDHKVVSKFAYNLKLWADIMLTSSSAGHTVVDRRNASSQFTDRQRVHPQGIGPEVEQTFLASNLGLSPIENVWVNLSVPVQTQDGEFLIYLLDVIRTQTAGGGPPQQLPATPYVVSADGQTRGTCYIPSSAINPLRLTAVDRSWSGGVGSSVASEFPNPSLLRSRRDAKTTIEITEETASTVRAARSAAPSLMEERVQRVVSCDQPLENLGTPICLHIPCRIDRLGRGEAVRVVFRGWVWADTLFKHKFSDIAVVTTASSQVPRHAFGIPVAGNFTIASLTVSQNYVFEGIKMEITQTIPILPIIIGVVLGCLLLVIIIIILWRCGFFKRKRPMDEMTVANDVAIKQENNCKPV